MTSAAKIAANRRNARKSTGPRSQAGKMRSRRNAFRHGLAIPIASDIVLAGQIEPLTNELVATAAQAGQHAAARIAALAQLELARAQRVKVQIINRAAQDLQEQNSYDPEALVVLGYARQLKTLVRLDRYERRALSRRNRALRALDSPPRIHRPNTKPVRWCKLFVRPAWAFNIHALVKTVLDSISSANGEDWNCPEIQGLRVTLKLQDDQSGFIRFTFAQGPNQEFVVAKTLRRHGGRQWGAICPQTGKTVEDLLLRETEHRIGSRYMLRLSYRSKYRKHVPGHPASDIVMASVSSEPGSALPRPTAHSAPMVEPRTSNDFQVAQPETIQRSKNRVEQHSDQRALDDQSDPRRVNDHENRISSVPRPDCEQRSSGEPPILSGSPGIIDFQPANDDDASRPVKPVDTLPDGNLKAADRLHAEGRLDETLTVHAAVCEPAQSLAETVGSSVEAAEPGTSPAQLPASLPIDLETGIRLRANGKLDEALITYRRAVTDCRAKVAEDDSQAQYHFGFAVSELGRLAFDFLLKRRVPEALATITEAMSSQPDWLWLELVHAHVLMLTARKTDALNIHRRNYGRTMDNGEPWGATISADFAALRGAGYTFPIMDEIERQFACKE